MKKKDNTTGKPAGRKRRGEKPQSRSNVRYQLKASYEGNKRIYTILDISADSTLDDLCGMILDAFEFTHEHLYLYNFGGRGYGEGADIYTYMPEPGENGTNIRLGEINLTLRQKFYFLYDFGDDWGFDIQVQKIYETTEHVINGIVSVKGELEQYPEWKDEEEDGGDLFDGMKKEDWESLFDSMGEEDWESLFDSMGEEDLEEQLMNMLDGDDLEALNSMDESDLESLAKKVVAHEMRNLGKDLSVFRIDPALTVREILDSLEEDDVRFYAAAFLDEQNRSDCLVRKEIDWVCDQYASALLQNREHMLLFQRNSTAKVFRFMMTAQVDPESGVLNWEELWESLPIYNEVYAQEISMSFMHLYTMGVCMPEMNDKGEIQCFLIPQEMRDAYENWMNQSRVSTRQKFYEEMQEIADILMIRYGVIEIERLHAICQEILHKKMKKEDFKYLVGSRLVYWGRYDIYALPDGIAYVSVFSLEDTEAVVQERQDYPELTYRSFSKAHCEEYAEKGPFWDVEGYQELLNTIWKSVQDVQTLGMIIQKVTDMGMLGEDPEDIIQGVRLELNSSGKRMTKKIQGLIRETAKNMPLAARYGYAASETEV